mgnify:CR=1 FL=1
MASNLRTREAAAPLHGRPQPLCIQRAAPYVCIVCQAGRGGFDAEKICDTLRAKGINMLFVIGGDGTQFAGHLLFEEAQTDRWMEARWGGRPLCGEDRS